MAIILTNDDGIGHEGLARIHEAVQSFGDIQVYAPHTERSATSHALTIRDYFNVRRVEFDHGTPAYAVEGTPVDCAKLAISLFGDAPPRLILSGINRGANMGLDMLYSGTVAAALEGAIAGIPAAAFSLCAREACRFDTAAGVAKAVTRMLLANGLPAHVALNVNIPNLPFDELQGMKITKLGRSGYREVYRKKTEDGVDSYMTEGVLDMRDETNDFDAVAVGEGYVSITPVSFDMTAHGSIGRMRETWASGKPEGWGVETP